MSESYEIVLQKVPANNLLSLLNELESRSEIYCEISSSDDISISSKKGFCKDIIDAFINKKGEICLTENLYIFRIFNDIHLQFVLLRVIKYDNDIDIELSFDNIASSDINNVMIYMQKYTADLSKKFKIEEFYGGLEPAIDTSTRYFTNGVLGPL